MDSQYEGFERRRYKRIPARFNVSYSVLQPQEAFLFFGDKKINAVTQDISEGGMAIVTDCDIPELSTLSINFDFTRPMQVQGEVRYNVTLSPSTHRLGVCFIDIKKSDRSAIANFVTQDSH